MLRQGLAVFALLWGVWGVGSDAAWAGDTGLVPLIDLGGDTYQGFEGGLYPGGGNAPPVDHATGALVAAARVLPRNAMGVADARGKIGLLSIGMSNTNQEFKAFERLADLETLRNGSIVLVNGAVAGEAAEDIADPAAPYWDLVAERLEAAGVSSQQVQVAWLKQANRQPDSTDFPRHAEGLRDDLAVIVRELRSRFPNLELCFVSSRIFGGYNTNPFRSEPISYEGGFAVRWLIGDQIAGSLLLNPDPSVGPVRAPWLLWGPYLWADGTTPRSDGLLWNVTDLENDGVHPSRSGEAKVAALLGDFVATSPFVQPWWQRSLDGPRVIVAEAEDDATLSSAEPDTPMGLATKLRPVGGSQPSTVYVRFIVPEVSGEVLHAKLSLRNDSPFFGTLDEVVDQPWDEATVTWANAPPLGRPVGAVPEWSRDSALGHDLTELVTSAGPGASVNVALRTTHSQARVLQSRQDLEPPRLVLTVVGAALLVDGFESGDTRAWSRTVQ